MEELRATTNIVKYLLETNPQTRNSDSYLYLKVLEYKSEKNGIDLNGVSVPLFFTSIKEYGFPIFETVRRARQKIQQENPELSACKKVSEYRAENEQKFRVYARGEFKC